MDLTHATISILGSGNIGCAIAEGIVSAGLVASNRIILTRRSVEHLDRYKEQGFRVSSDNVEALKASELVIIAVTPQRLNALLAEIKDTVSAERHVVVSIVSGATIAQIQRALGADVPVIRVMPNTAIAIRESMTCISAHNAGESHLKAVQRLFEAMGKVVVIDESLMVPATALCACGIAFFLRAIRAASQGGIEIGFHAEDALLMAAQTARGAASLLVEAGNHPERELDKVTTPQGCTISGLNQMEHNGFSSALIKGIVTSAEKAAVLYAPKE